MSTSYHVEFKKTDSEGKTHSLAVWMPSSFGDVLDEIDSIRRRTEDQEGYSAVIETYRFDDMDKVLSKLKAKCAETNKDIEEKKKSRPLANSAEVYELIGSYILEDESMLEYLSERVSFLDLIIQGVKFHFLYVEDLWDANDIFLDVQLCC